MDYKIKVKALREIVPVPISEALKLLKENDGNIEQCADIFKSKSIEHICSETGCSKDMAIQFYEKEKFDLNRTISFIREELFDQNYKAINNLSLENLNKTRSWVAIVQEKDFATSLDYSELETVIKVLVAIPSLREIGMALKQAKRIKDSIFKGYSDDLSIDEFVRRNVKLDDDVEFQKSYQRISLSSTIIIDEINRHRRNL